MSILPFLPLIGAGISLFGSLFGNNSSQQQQQSQTQNSNTQAGAASTTGTSLKGTTTGQGETSQSSNQTTTGVTGQTQDITTALSELVSGVQSGSINRLDAETLSMLTNGVQSLMGLNTMNRALTQDQLNAVMQGEDFDVDAFVNGIMASATSRAQGNMESDTARIRQAIGGKGSTNSAVALLESRLRNDTAAELAGTQAQATATGNQIRQQGQESRTSQIGVLTGNNQTEFTNMLNALLGANERTVGQSSQQSTGAQQQGLSGTTTSAQQTSGITEQFTKTIEQALQEQLQQQTGEQYQTTRASATGTGNTNTQENNWGDFFKNVGNIFTSIGGIQF